MAAMRETTGAEERTQDQSTTATRTARKPRAAAKPRTKTSTKTSGTMPPTPIAAKEPNLLEKLRAEADGIFIFALEGLKRLINNNYKFSETERNKRELEQYREESDNVLSFVGECCELGADYDYGSTELYNAYKGFCEDSGVKPYSQKNFVKQLLANIPGTDKGVDKLGKRRIITGIRFIPDDFD